MAESEAPQVRGFLFADLRGFTQFVEKHGDRAAAELLKAYRTIVRAAVARFSGAEIRTEGDGFYVVFPSPSSAIRCAIEILDEAASSTAAAGQPIPVGIGIHAGETDDSAEGFVGSAVNIAARVCALAGPGELLVTETVRSLVRTSMPLAMEPRGRRHLKGIREPIALFAVRPPGVALSRSRRLRAVSTWERRPLLAAFAAFAGLAAVATVVMATGLLTNTKANPGAGTRPGPTTSGAASPAPSPSSLGVYPNPAEQKLLARLDSSVASFCRRATTGEYPLMPLTPRLDGKPVFGRLPVQAGLRCGMAGSGADLVFLWTVAPTFKEPIYTGGVTSATVDTYFFRDAANSRALPGDCAKGEAAYMNWSFGPLQGKLLCVATPGTARIEWTYEGEDLITTAERDDGDRVALYQWWLDTGRSMLH